MADTTTTSATSTSSSRATSLRTLRVLAALSVLTLFWQFVTAGQLFPRGGPEELHSWGAVALHVFTGLTALAAGLHLRATRGPVWPTVLAVAVFALSFVQAYVGERSTLYVHVPGAIVLTVGSVWLLAWACSPVSARSAR